MSSTVPLITRSRATTSLAFASSAAIAIVLAQARRVALARMLAAKAPSAFSHLHPEPRHRLLLVGDSTGAGVGCERARDSIAARIASDFRQSEVRNLCRSGATVGDVLRTVRAMDSEHVADVVLVFAGGNDVLRRTPWRQLEQETDALLAELDGLSRLVVWVGMANVGLAPLFMPPFSWWITARTRRVNQVLARRVTASGARFVDFFHERGTDPFSAHPSRFYARDRVHPSAHAYAYCYARMRPAIARALRAG